MSKIVIALGGNALGNTPQQQQSLIESTALKIAVLAKDNQIVLSHGNGPQVGIINLAFEDSYENANIPYMPFPECTAMSQGYIGYHLQKGLRKAFLKQGMKIPVATIITQILVGKEDPSFENPTKPVGPFYTKEMAEEQMKLTGEVYIEDAGRGYRKVVASPMPIEIVESKTIEDLSQSGHIVIACGGGGIPVYKEEEDKGASAVIDKDLASSLLAQNINADILLILTNIKQAEKYYRTEKAEKIGKITVEEAKQDIIDGHFAKGSMLPKIEAAIWFVEKTGGRAIITSLDNLENAIEGKETTEIYLGNE